MKKVIFLDVDGTLVSSNNQVSDKVKEAILKVRKNNHYVLLCTGRTKCSIEVFRDIGFDGYICGGGSYIEIHNQIIVDHDLNDEEISRILKLFKKHHLFYTLEGNKATYQDPLMMFLIKLGRLIFKDKIKRLQNKYRLQPLKDYPNDQIYKMCFISIGKRNLKKIKPYLSHQYHFLVHGKRYGCIYHGEIIPKNDDKGQGVKRVLEYLNISKEDSLCFGDSMNDIAMMEACGYRVMMANGYDGLKEYCDNVCESVHHDGIYHELKRLGLFE